MSRPPEPDATPVANVEPEGGPVASEADRDLARRIGAGDESAFLELVSAHHALMRRVAATFVPSAAVADEVVQETWLAVLEGLSRWQGRASLRTWIFRILGNRARTRGVREARSVPFSSLAAHDAPAVDADRFDHRGHWRDDRPSRWSDDTPERLLEHAQTRRLIEQAVAALPDNQRAVIELRDLGGWTSHEVCAALGITEVNQRVLLHRARARVRAAIERHLDGEPSRGSP